MRKFLTKRNIITAVVLVAAVSGWYMKSRNAARPVVKTATVVRKDLVQSLSVSGKIDAEKKATLTFPLPGKLAFVTVKPGDLVTAGAWLAGLNLGDLQAMERKAYYAYVAADAYAKLIEDQVKGHDSDETFLQKDNRVAAQTARDTAYDSWLTARRAINNATLKTPISGVVASVSVNVAGETIGVTDGVIVVDPSSLFFNTQVNETDIVSIKTGQEVEINLDAFPREKFTGVVKRIGFATITGDTGATVLPVWISLPQEALPRMKLGLNGDGNIVLATAKNVLTLPVEAVTNGKVTLKDGQKKKIETGLESDFDVEIKSGLNEGDVVIIK